MHPTHGFGSFCAPAARCAGRGGRRGTGAAADGRTARPGGRLDHRQGQRHNPALTQDVDSYVTGLLAGLDEYPAYYVRMGPANAAGPGPAELAPPGRPARPS